MKNTSVLFLTLNTFSLTGGIEKVCKTFAKTLSDLKTDQNIADYRVLSMYDDQADHQYISPDHFKGYKGNQSAFGLAAIKQGFKANILVLSHVHLLLFAKIIRQLKPGIRIILFAHGIEIWHPLANWKKKFLNQIEIWAVSHHTAEKTAQQHSIYKNRIKVLNNSLDPFFKFSGTLSKPENLLTKYDLNTGQKVLLTICRLSSSEQYKGYDRVIESLKQVVSLYPDLIYLLVGKADATEQQRVNKLVANLGLQQNVKLVGFVPEDELTQHYQLADAFVMPSKAEGFGLVFIEAAAQGCPVIGGNADGSTDALLNGELGILVDPENLTEIGAGILTALQKGKDEQLTKKCTENFGYESYQKKVSTLINPKETLYA